MFHVYGQRTSVTVTRAGGRGGAGRAGERAAKYAGRTSVTIAGARSSAGFLSSSSACALSRKVRPIVWSTPGAARARSSSASRAGRASAATGADAGDSNATAWTVWRYLSIAPYRRPAASSSRASVYRELAPMKSEWRSIEAGG